MISIDENIKDIVENVVRRNGFFIIDMILRGTGYNKIIEVYLDGEKDVSADDCAIVSREIDIELKELLTTHPDYRLDVSSPGIDRPLKFLKQYNKHINRKFDIDYISDEVKKKLSGKLISVEGEYLTFISNNKEVIINFSNIIKANVVVSFS